MRKTYLLTLLISTISVLSFESSDNFSLKKIEIPISDSHYRGLHVVNDSVIWISGTSGAVMSSSDNGKTWKSKKLSQKVDFRDIHGFNHQEAVMISSEENHVFIMRTSDSGNNWTVAYEDSLEGTFFNGINFINSKVGFAYGDPINGKINLLRTIDGGKSWKKVNTNNYPSSLEGEAGFAASGTGLIVKGNSIYIAQGSANPSRILVSKNLGDTWEYITTPLIAGEGKGIYGMDFYNENIGIIIGGGWQDIDDKTNNSAITLDGGKTWLLSSTMANGYRSGAAFHNRNVVFCTGRNGMDISLDGGLNWKSFSDIAMYTVQSYKGNTWFSGKNGGVYQLIEE